jgi:hypothetical protein
MRHSNQIGIFWQVEFSAMTKSVQISSVTRAHQGSTKDAPRLSLNSVQEMITSPSEAREPVAGRPCYFFNVSPRKLTIRFQASAASAAR